MAKAVKTNVMRRLDTEKIPYEVRTYPVDEEHLDGLHAAEMLGLDPLTVFKTLVLTGDRGQHLVCVIPVGSELDLKAVAQASGHKSVSMLPLKELLPLTGYVRGGCSPIGMKKPFPTYVDESAASLGEITFSAGARGCQVTLSPGALIRLTKGVYAPLCR